MKATITCKNNCITVATKNESSTLYDDQLNKMVNESTSLQVFTDEVSDYFSTEFDEDVQCSYKELQQACKKVYKAFKTNE